MRNIDPDVFAHKVGQMDDLLPSHSIFGVGAMRHLHPIEPNLIGLAIGIRPIHEAKGAVGSQLFEHERTVDLSPPSIFEAGSDDPNISDMIVGIGPLYGDQ